MAIAYRIATAVQNTIINLAIIAVCFAFGCGLSLLYLGLIYIDIPQ